MLKNHFKIALRHLWKNRSYSLLNILGLAIGLACCLLIVLYVQHEMSYDRYHPKAEQTYRVGYEVGLGTGTKVIASSPYRLAEALKNDFPQLESVTHFHRMYTDQVSYRDKIFRENRISFVEPSFLEVFQLSFLQGDPGTALSKPNQVVITDKIAEKYFGHERAVGKNLEVAYAGEFMDLTVSGVIREMPSNSHFHMNVLISMETGKQVFPESLFYNWGWDSHYTYVVLPDNYEAAQFESALLDFGKKYIEGPWFVKFFAQKMTDIHLYSNLNSEIEANGSITYVYIFSLVALLILVIACVNYMNLATARAAKRTREVGIRKAVGAQRIQLVAQFMGESLLLVLLSLVVAIGIAELAMPLFNELSGKAIEINLLSNTELLAGFVAVTILVGLFSGSYPAFFLSSFKPVKVLKESVSRIDKGALWLKKGLVTFQFGISIILIAGTTIVYKQLDFLRSKELGANTEQVVMVPVQTSGIVKNYDSIRDELLKNNNIREVTTTSRQIGLDINSGNIYTVSKEEGKESSSRMSNIWVGWEFFDFYDVDVLHGRVFSRDMPSDTVTGVAVINREAARVLDLKPDNAVGKLIVSGHFRDTIIGVVENFHFEALYNQIKPMVFFLDKERLFSFVNIRVDQANYSETMSYIRSVWKRYEPDRLFISRVLDEQLYNLYRSEERFLQIFSVFSFLAIFTACLGIFGLAMFTASQRTREIGIRKVLGASVRDIVSLLTREFVQLVGIAFIIAAPLAYIVMSKWLQQFAYKTEIGIGVFILAGLAALVIAWLTVSWQSIKAATMNPVKSLRNE